MATAGSSWREPTFPNVPHAHTSWMIDWLIDFVGTPVTYRRCALGSVVSLADWSQGWHEIMLQLTPHISPSTASWRRQHMRDIAIDSTAAVIACDSTAVKCAISPRPEESRSKLKLNVEPTASNCNQMRQLINAALATPSEII